MTGEFCAEYGPEEEQSSFNQDVYNSRVHNDTFEELFKPCPGPRLEMTTACSASNLWPANQKATCLTTDIRCCMQIPSGITISLLLTNTGVA